MGHPTPCHEPRRWPLIAIVLVAHSPAIAAGLREMLRQSAPAVPVHVAAGSSTGALGTSTPLVEEALRGALRAADGVLVLLDLGSAALALELAMEALSDRDAARVAVSTGPLVEGAVLAAVAATGGAPLAAVLDAADRAAAASKLPDDWPR